MEYFQKILDRDVWVSICRPFTYDRTTNSYQQESNVAVAFRIDSPPGILGGEYLRDSEGKLRWFPHPHAAAAAAFDEAEARISQVQQ